MKIFYILAKVELIIKPEGLDAFRAKYDKPYPYHITLKQPCNIEEGELLKVKYKFEEFLRQLNSSELNIVFDELLIDRSPSGLCIMLKTNNAIINDLHEKIVKALADYKDYLKPEYEKFENLFKAHITIGRELNQDDLDLATKDLPGDLKCEGVVKELIFLVVKEKTVQETINPMNQAIYKLASGVGI